MIINSGYIQEFGTIPPIPTSVAFPGREQQELSTRKNPNSLLMAKQSLNFLFHYQGCKSELVIFQATIP